jgi:hypothetical protein
LETGARDGTGAEDEYLEPLDSWIRLWMCSGVTSRSERAWITSVAFLRNLSCTCARWMSGVS